MAIPDFQSIMLPLLKVLQDENEHTFRDVVKELSVYFKLTEEEKSQLLPSGSQPTFSNRVGWARTHLLKAGLLNAPRKGILLISDRGKEVLKCDLNVINIAYLKQFEEYLQFIKGTTSKNSEENDQVIQEHQTPEEILEEAYEIINKSLASELLDRVKLSPPEFFEELVLELLVKMGYGGSITDAASTTNKGKDQGIDGIIKEDKLGLDNIYIQAKRWESSVGRPEIQKFVGALAGQGAKKGIFITTSSFSSDAINYAPKNDIKVVMIDGTQLAKYMIEYNIGVSPSQNYEVKKIDSDYFES